MAILQGNNLEPPSSHWGHEPPRRVVGVVMRREASATNNCRTHPQQNSQDRPEGRHRPADWGVIFCPSLQWA
jgi:hypothetical protein